MTWAAWANLLGRFEAFIGRALGDDDVVEIEVDRESVGLFWTGEERVPAVVAFLTRLIAHHHGLGEPPHLALWEEEGARQRLIDASNPGAFAGKLIGWLRIPCLDFRRLEVPAEGISMPIRFEGTATRGLVVLFLEGPNPAVMRDLAEQLGEKFGVCFRLGGGGESPPMAE